MAYAGIISRGVAFAIDVTISAVISSIGALLLGVSAQALGFQPDGGGFVALGYLMSLSIVFATYCALFWWLSGRTPGMALLGVRVVRADGRKPGPGRAALRSVAYAVSAIFLIGFAWIVVDRRRQGFHDKIAHTFVVYDDEVVLELDRSEPLTA